LWALDLLFLQFSPTKAEYLQLTHLHVDDVTAGGE
jgi:hypothetical protein